MIFYFFYTVNKIPRHKKKQEVNHSYKCYNAQRAAAVVPLAALWWLFTGDLPEQVPAGLGDQTRGSSYPSQALKKERLSKSISNIRIFLLFLIHDTNIKRANLNWDFLKTKKIMSVL